MEDNKKYIKVERHRWADEVEAEKKRTRNRFLVILSCLLCFGLGFGLSTFSLSEKTATNSSSSNLNKFDQVYDIMKNNWYFGKEIKNLDEYLINNAMQGLTVNDYDIHTSYMNAEKGKKYMEDLEGNVVGIGILYYNLDGDAVVDRVYAASPAEKAGLQPGDILKKCNGISLEGKSLDDIASLVKGEEGTEVKLEILRGNETIQVEMKRETVLTSAYGYIKDGIGILEIESIAENTDTEVGEYLANFKKNNVKGLIIDVRDNGGGYVDTVIKICSYFMDEGKTVIYENNKNDELTEYATKESKKYEFDNISILVNEGTASAAEVLTACLKEQIGANVIGMKTYGKGTMQTVKIFDDGSYMKYTMAEWLTPNKEKINKKGITPDIKVELDPAITNVMSKSKKSFSVDSVGNPVKDAQIYLRFLGYDIDRIDGYYSQKTLTAVNKFQQENELEVNGVINLDLNKKIVVKARAKYHNEEATLDTQMIKAMEVANGK